MPRLRTRTTAHLLVSASLVAAATLAGHRGHAEDDAPENAATPVAEAEPRVFELTPVDLIPRLASQRTGMSWFRPVGETLAIGKHELPVKATDKGLLVAPAVGKVPNQRIETGGLVNVTVKEDGKARRLTLHVRRSAHAESQGWEFARVDGWRLSVSIAAVDLVDLDGDGRITPDAGDGYRAPGSALTLPLRDTLTLGADRLHLVRIEPGKLHARVERLAEKPDQRVALGLINKARLRDGLPPVVLDEKLSAACTAHADYLRANRWSGYTNPHSEDESKPGYTKEGAVAAYKSVIMGEPHSFSIDAYLTTVYHRAGFSDPFLERVGISTGTRRISVIDVQSGSPELEEPHPEWKDPILVPADGSIGFGTRFCGRGEVPAPTSRPSTRGNPLTALFARWDHGVIDVECELLLLEGGEEIPVETIVAEPQQGSRLVGVVPARPLKSGATYRVSYRFERYDEPDQTATATFTTK